jgi:hypothetical protein
MSAKRNPAQEGQKASKPAPNSPKKSPTSTTPELVAQTPNQGIRTNSRWDSDVALRARQGAMVAPPKGSKQQLVLSLLSAANGASISELTAVTNWLPHSTRAVLSRLRKQGYVFDRQKTEGGVRYKMLGTPPAQDRA